MTRRAASSRSRPARGVRGWLTTVLIVVIIVGGALRWRGAESRESDGQARPASEALYLPRTRALVMQKVNSLATYNQATGEDELLQFFSRHLSGRAVLPEAFAAMSSQVVDQILPNLWQESESIDPESRFIAYRAMAATIQRSYPREVLTNADVILFPQDRELRIIVAEPGQDHFRDSGWHWRWIGLFLDALGADRAPEMKELDIYAAEELSEFLSVFAVGLLELAARDLNGTDRQVDAQAIRSTFARITGRAQPAHKAETEEKGRYSLAAKLRVMASVRKPMFRDVTRDVKLNFRHAPNRDLRKRQADLEVPVGLAGGGVAAADFDADGHPDLYFAGDRGGSLYRNISGKRFEEVTRDAGLRLEGESRAGYFIDYDNDGDRDLFVTFVAQSNRLYQNDGHGRFADVTRDVGLSGRNDVTHEAVWFDMDNDGDLDLYTACFGNWPEGASPTIGRFNTDAGPNRLFRQERVQGRPSFVEIAGKLGVDDRGWTHCVGAWDFDRDGYPDLFSLNDFGASMVYHNVDGKAFTEVSRSLHLDATYNAMNFTLLPFGHGHQPSIYVTQIMKHTHRQRYRRPTEDTRILFGAMNLENLRTLATNRLYQMRPDGTYEDVHGQLLEPTDLGWAWDASGFDYENDGDLDLLVLNGTVSKIPTLPGESRPHHLSGRYFQSRHAEQRNVCFLWEQGYFYDVSEMCALAYVGNSRGSSIFDFDGDGDQDIVINDFDAPARIFENLQQTGHAWVRFELEGTRSNRNAIGARVEIQFSDQVRFDQVVSGSGFLSQNPLTLHFGLGQVRKIDKAVITWPSGTVQELSDLDVNQTHAVAEPELDTL